MNNRNSHNNTIRYLACGGFSAALFGLNFLLGATLSYATGIPGLSGLITGLTTGFLLAIAWLSLPYFGTATIVFTLYCVLAIPTVLMGPPGIYKVAVGLFSGLAYDIFALIIKNKKLHLLAGWTAYTVVILILTYLFFVLLNLPGIEKFEKMVIFLFAIFLIEGWIGTLFAKWFFNKHLSKLDLIQNLEIKS